jgi:ABC-2 type transport system permease protein
VHVPWFSFTIALLLGTWSILSIGFLIASIVPTARFAQPIGAVLLDPMIAFSGLFVHMSDLPQDSRSSAENAPGYGLIHRLRAFGPVKPNRKLLFQ